MADRTKAKRKTRRTAGRPKGVPPAAAPPAPERPEATPPAAPTTASQILDLTGAADRRPVVKLDFGEYQMLLVEELTFAQFSEQAAIGKRLVAVGDDVDEPGILDELQALVAEGVQAILVDMDDEAAQKVTPGQFLKISSFFNTLGAADVTTSSEPGSSEQDDASDSSEVSEAA